MLRPLNDFEKANTEYLERLRLDYGYLQPTHNGLENNIMDARTEYRKFLTRQSIHDYESQTFGGKDNGQRLPVKFILRDRIADLPDASIYRARTRGDRRIWFPQLREYIEGGETLLSLWLDGQLWLLNASRLIFDQSSALATVVTDAPMGNLRDYLIRIASGYDSRSPHSTGHIQLRRAHKVLVPLIPGGLKVISSGDSDGKFTATLTPWVGILDPDEAETSEDGIHLVLMFKRDLDEVVLTLRQGVASVRKRLDTRDSLLSLQAETERIRLALRADLQGLDAQVDFGRDPRQAEYAAANIASKTYSIADMPTEEQIRADLLRMLRLYQDAAWVKGSPADSTRPYERASSGNIGQSVQEQLVPKEFKPKDRRDYLVQIHGRTEQRRGDRHELLLTQYAELAERLGHQPSNTGVHPRDLTLKVAGEEWLVEAKVVYNGNASQAARAAIGQLLEYSHFLYEPDCQPRKMALFTEPLGDAFIALFEVLGIGAVWKGEKGWEASSLAREVGLI